MKFNWHNFVEVLLTLLVCAITGYLIYSDFSKERQPTACEIDGNSEVCYYETKDSEYDNDYQTGGQGLE
jgi:hypothetical protein